MAKLLKLRRGTTSQHSSFTGAEGEVTVDTDKKVVVVHDGSTAGGVPLATATDVSGKQASDADLTNLAGCQTGASAALALLTSTEVEILDGATLSTTELNYVDGVTSAIQTQLNAKGVGDVTLAGAQSFTGVKTFNAAAVGEVTALTDGATIATDLALSNNFSVTLAGNRTLGQPTNQAVGQSGSYFITQDGTGSRTLAYHADFKWVGGTAPTLSTAAASVDRIDYIVAAANKIHAVASLDVK